jgi:hypothetical protein
MNIPAAALEAGARAIAARNENLSMDALSAAIAAALNAWPGMSQLAENDSASIREMAALILPLPQGASDE